MEYDVIATNASLLTTTSENDVGSEPRTEITDTFIGYIAVVFGSIFSTSVVGNAIVLLGIYREPSLQIVRNYFIASLAVADFLTGLVAVPTAVIYYLFYRRSFKISGMGSEFSEGASLYTIPLFYFIWASIHNLLLITFDRFVAVNWPLTYVSKLTPKRAFGLIALSWFASLYPCIIPFFWELEQSEEAGLHFDIFGNKVRNWICCVYCTCVLIVIVTLHLKTYKIARKQSKRISSGHHHGSKTSHIGSRSPSHLLHRGTMKLYWEIQQKAFRSTTLVLSVFVITLFPLVITTSTNYVCGHMVSPALVWIAEVAMFCSSSINPFIYAFMRQDFNAAFRKLFGCRTHIVHDRDLPVI